ncbi:MAG: hypothetical protein WD060_11310 [Pirellulales bacterium]
MFIHGLASDEGTWFDLINELRAWPEFHRVRKNIVLVGHSMGGLHAKLQVVAPGNTLREAVACRPFDQMDLEPPVRQFIREAFFFEPLPFVARIVCVATPHRGSILASLGVGRLAAISVRPPPQLAAIHTKVHHYPLTVVEIQRILVLHLQETGLGAAT